MSIMSRSGAFYVIKTMERAATGTTAADPSRIPSRRAVDHEAPAAARPDRRSPSLMRRVLAAVKGAPGQTGRGRRLGRAARAN